MNRKEKNKEAARTWDVSYISTAEKVSTWNPRTGEARTFRGKNREYAAFEWIVNQ